MPALPSFDGGVKLENISTNSNQPLPVDPANAGAAPSEPMSVHGTHPSGGPPNPTKPAGFGENTLLWMQPPKPPPDARSGGTGDILPKVDKKASAIRRLKTMGMMAIILTVVAVSLYTLTGTTKKGVLELHTTPPKAKVSIRRDDAERGHSAQADPSRSDLRARSQPRRPQIAQVQDQHRR